MPWQSLLLIGPLLAIFLDGPSVLSVDKAVSKLLMKVVEDAGPFLLGSFDCKPCNITEKINLGYKTREFQLYMFGLSPALLYGVLPERYWINYCKLICGIQILSQHRITNTDILSVHVLLCNWETEFEEIYYQLHEDPSFRAPLCPSSCSPCQGDRAQRTPNLLCSVDHGAHHWESRSGNSTTIQSIC